MPDGWMDWYLISHMQDDAECVLSQLTHLVWSSQLHLFWEILRSHTMCMCLPYFDGLHFWAFLSWLSALKGRQYGFSTVLKLRERERGATLFFFWSPSNEVGWHCLRDQIFCSTFSCIWCSIIQLLYILVRTKFSVVYEPLIANTEIHVTSYPRIHTGLTFFFWPNIQLFWFETTNLYTMADKMRLPLVSKIWSFSLSDTKYCL